MELPTVLISTFSQFLFLNNPQPIFNVEPAVVRRTQFDLIIIIISVFSRDMTTRKLGVIQKLFGSKKLSIDDDDGICGGGGAVGSDQATTATDDDVLDDAILEVRYRYVFWFT